MDITIEDSDTLSKICREADQTPQKLVEAYMASLTFLYYTYEQARNEGTERRSFNDILTNLLKQILSCTPSNLDLAPLLIAQTNKLVGIYRSIGASIHDLLFDYDKRTVSYYIHHTLCYDAEQ